MREIVESVFDLGDGFGGYFYPSKEFFVNNRSRFSFVLVAMLLWLGFSVTGGEVDRSLSDSRLATLDRLMQAALSANPEISLNDLLKATSSTFLATEKCLQATSRPPLILEPEPEMSRRHWRSPAV